MRCMLAYFSGLRKLLRATWTRMRVVGGDHPDTLTSTAVSHLLLWTFRKPKTTMPCISLVSLRRNCTKLVGAILSPPVKLAAAF